MNLPMRFRHHAKVLSVSSALIKASLFELKRYFEEKLKLACDEMKQLKVKVFKRTFGYDMFDTIRKVL